VSPRRRRSRRPVRRFDPGPWIGTALTLAVAAGGIGYLASDGGEVVTVERVVDGDTFVTTEGDRVRVLGIDSCERTTPGGPRATAAARELIEGQQVTLGQEPGVDADRYGRELRYVALPDGRDLAELMAAADHTEVYAGRNDASPERVAALRALDGDPTRTCDR
jgi:micrococcal nuclease